MKRFQEIGHVAQFHSSATTQVRDAPGDFEVVVGDRGRSWAIHREDGAEPSASPWECFVLGFHRLLGCEINKKEPTGSPTAKVRKVDDTPEWLLQAESALKERIAEEREAHAR